MENFRVAKLTKKLERGLIKSREIFEALDPHQRPSFQLMLTNW